jgi:hypothetical protein
VVTKVCVCELKDAAKGLREHKIAGDIIGSLDISYLFENLGLPPMQRLALKKKELLALRAKISGSSSEPFLLPM